MTDQDITQLIAETNRLRMKAISLLNRDIGSTYLINTECLIPEKTIAELMRDLTNTFVRVTEETNKPSVEIIDLRLDPSIKAIIELIIENENIIHEHYKK